MAHVVFLRAANVGGNNVFRPAELARSLGHLGVVNIGAAGTFVVRERASATAIRREIATRLPFALDITVRSAASVLEIVRQNPFENVKFARERRGWIAVLAAPAKQPVVLPVAFPNRTKWAVRIDGCEGVFAHGMWRLRPGGFVIPANAVERALGVSATVRWWETFERIARELRAKG